MQQWERRLEKLSVLRRSGFTFSKSDAQKRVHAVQKMIKEETATLKRTADTTAFVASLAGRNIRFKVTGDTNPVTCLTPELLNDKERRMLARYNTLNSAGFCFLATTLRLIHIESRK